MPPLHLTAENLALRQQLAVFKRETPRPRLRRRDRIFWVWLSWLWSDWRSALVIVQPETVVDWHRAGFRLYWRFKSRKSGRPTISPEVRQLIRRMAKENPLWGAPRSPWQNPYVEWLIGSIRRECLNHVIVLNESLLTRILTDYFCYYNEARTHQSLDGDAPDSRHVEPPDRGQVIAIPQVGGCSSLCPRRGVASVFASRFIQRRSRSARRVKSGSKVSCSPSLPSSE